MKKGPPLRQIVLSLDNIAGLRRALELRGALKSLEEMAAEVGVEIVESKELQNFEIREPREVRYLDKLRPERPEHERIQHQRKNNFVKGKRPRT